MAEAHICCNKANKLGVGVYSKPDEWVEYSWPITRVVAVVLELPG